MDIVDKLRDRANAPTLAVSELNHDAADEIERLRAWVSVKTQEEARAHDYSVRMHNKNALLREALEDIASGRYSGVLLTSFPPKDPAVERARAALAHGRDNRGRS